MRFWLTLIGTLLVDLVSKYLVMTRMTENQSIPVINHIFYLTYIQNPGAAFGLLSGHTYLFILIAVVLLAAMVAGYRYIARATIYQYAIGLIGGGALGNLIDRIRFTRVVDFLDFRVWPIFNLADSAICIGVGLLVWDILRQQSKDKQDRQGR